MNELDKLLREALAAAQFDLLPYFDEPSLPAQVLETLRGRNRLLVAMAFVSLPFLLNAAREGFAAVPERLEKAARTLGIIGSADSQPQLLAAMLQDPAPEMRLAAAQALLAINSTFSIAFLVHALNDPTLSATLEEGLLKADNPCTAAFLGPLLRSDDPAVRRAAARLLVEGAKPSHLSMILQLLNDSKLRQPAQAALSRLRTRRDSALPVSIALLENEEFAKSARQFLMRTTGKDLGAEPAPWFAWLKTTTSPRIQLVPVGAVDREQRLELRLRLRAPRSEQTMADLVPGVASRGKGFLHLPQASAQRTIDFVHAGPSRQFIDRPHRRDHHLPPGRCRSEESHTANPDRTGRKQEASATPHRTKRRTDKAKAAPSRGCSIIRRRNHTFPRNNANRPHDVFRLACRWPVAPPPSEPRVGLIHRQ